MSAGARAERAEPRPGPHTRCAFSRIRRLGARSIHRGRLERLGSTGVGRGVAIPHGKLGGLSEIFGLFARLEQPVDFESVDSEPVDLVFLLLAPESAGADHLKALARISRLLREPAAIEKLRASKDDAALYALLTQAATSHAA